MKKFAIALIAIAAAASATAGEASYEEHNPRFSGQLTRAEVNAQYVAAKRAGSLPQVAEYAVDRNPGADVAGWVRDRAAVRAEAVQAARTRVIQELI